MRWKFAAVLFLLGVSPVFAKSLYWRALDVDARLDAEGRMHVTERQVMVFDGDWNGGERRFNLRQGQALQLNGISRVDNGLAAPVVPLTRGNLSFVDDWDFVAPNVVRWRSRRSTDPPFQHQEIIYSLDYVLSNILDQLPDGHVRLQHDFAFPDRDGVIETFTLNFVIDPAWRGLRSPIRIVRKNLPPGQSMVIVSDLTYAGAGKPAIHVPPTPRETLAFPIAMLLAGILLTIYFYSTEAQKGLFAPLFPQAQINEQWLQRYVFSLPPEAVGTAWDEATGAPEVGAVIARMVQEKKLTTSVTEEKGALTHKPVLHMKLDVDWKTLPDAEQKLVQALFLGKTETDTEAIAKHYRSTGFQPQSLIKDSINDILNKVPEWRESGKAVSTDEILVGLFTLLSFFVALRNVPEDLKVAMIAAVILALFGIGVAVPVRRSAQGAATLISALFAWAILFAAGFACYFATAHEVSFLFRVPAAAAGIAAAGLVLLVSRSRDSVAKLAFRRRLAAARAYFQSQLRLPNPNLHDAWYPYLVALGLGANVDQWFRAFSATSATSSTWSGQSSGDFHGSSSSGWTGGGGAFGGAGASGSWAAMSALAGGVAAPGSSSGGGGGGGGGSGGGGGGGW